MSGLHLAVVSVLLTTGCALVTSRAVVADLPTPVAVVRLEPARAWTDTGVTVRKGERLFFSATGAVHWGATGDTAVPDGIGGVIGWHVGSGGLVGRVGDAAKPFAIGSRTTLFPDRHPRPPHHPHLPPPITMPRDGTLFLGFKDFTAADNTGSFEVTICRESR